MILTLGERGVLLADSDGIELFPAFRVDRVIDTTAAGDAFLGGFATAMAEGKERSRSRALGLRSGRAGRHQSGSATIVAKSKRCAKIVSKHQSR